jgi:hypothetical protein
MHFSKTRPEQLEIISLIILMASSCSMLKLPYHKYFSQHGLLAFSAKARFIAGVLTTFVFLCVALVFNALPNIALSKKATWFGLTYIALVLSLTCW